VVNLRRSGDDNSLDFAERLMPRKEEFLAAFVESVFLALVPGSLDVSIMRVNTASCTIIIVDIGNTCQIHMQLRTYLWQAHHSLCHGQSHLYGRSAVVFDDQSSIENVRVGIYLQDLYDACELLRRRR
jgi:hypothetical protein